MVLPYGVYKVTFSQRWQDFCNAHYSWRDRINSLFLRKWDVRGPDGVYASFYHWNAAEQVCLYLNVIWRKNRDNT